MAKLQYQGTGRRKHSVARVRLIPGTGKITVNKKDLENYFGMEIVKREVRRPLEVAGVEGKFNFDDFNVKLAMKVVKKRLNEVEYSVIDE